MKTKLRQLILALLCTVTLAAPASGALQDVGIPIEPHGFPVYYGDANGLRLEPCLPPPAGNATLGTGSLCIFDPLIPGPLEVGAEIFYWMADAIVPMPGGGQAILVLALEGAFNSGEVPVDGQQIVFGRLRIRIDAPTPGTYTVTHPYGTRTFTNVPAGANAVNVTEDIGNINFLFPAVAFNGALAANGPFLVWPGYTLEPSLQLRAIDPITLLPTGPVLEQYVGDPNIPHVVTGSPNGTNFFRVQGPNGLDVQTNLFSVMGKVHDPNVVAEQHVFPAAPPQTLYAMGPVNRVADSNPAPPPTLVTGVDRVYPVGYPIWYQENSGTIATPAPGLQMTLCNPGDPMCISDPIDPNNATQVALRTGGEAFYWSADARLDIDPENRALLVLGLEATFGGTGAVIDGQQITFGRVRIRVDAPVPGTYTVTHPYGEEVFENVPAGPGAISFVSDIGIIDPTDPDAALVGALYSGIGPSLLKWTTFNPDPALTDPLLRKTRPAPSNLIDLYVGDPAIEHLVTGSPTGNNFFRVRGPGGIDVQTDLFAVSGKLYDPATFQFPAPPVNAPVAVADAATLDLALASSATINVLANDTFVAPGTISVLALGATANGGTAVAGGGVVVYTPRAGFSGTDTFTYQITTAAGTSNIATVTVTVVPVETVTVSTARLELRRLVWEVRGVSNNEGSTLTIYAGPNVGGTVVGRAVVSGGKWSLRTTATANATSFSIESSTGKTWLNLPLERR